MFAGAIYHKKLMFLSWWYHRTRCFFTWCIFWSWSYLKHRFVWLWFISILFIPSTGKVNTQVTQAGTHTHAHRGILFLFSLLNLAKMIYNVQRQTVRYFTMSNSKDFTIPQKNKTTLWNHNGMHSNHIWVLLFEKLSFFFFCHRAQLQNRCHVADSSNFHLSCQVTIQII